MKNLFTCQYTNNVDVFKFDGEMQFSIPYKFHIIVMCDYSYIYLKDEHNVHWAYAKNEWQIKVPNFYCFDLPIGKHTINHETFIRVSNAEIILSKIKKSLSPYILRHIWGKDVYNININ
jgi:hypothetical protein